jgi:hypothetical protein
MDDGRLGLQGAHWMIGAGLVVILGFLFLIVSLI